jgi:hypothetical protein
VGAVRRHSSSPCPARLGSLVPMLARQVAGLLALDHSAAHDSQHVSLA